MTLEGLDHCCCPIPLKEKAIPVDHWNGFFIFSCLRYFSNLIKVKITYAPR